MGGNALQVGQSADFSKMVTEADVVRFAEITGDRNPVHLDAAYAERSPFGGRVAHGMLTASFISTVLAMRLPGPGTGLSEGDVIAHARTRLAGYKVPRSVALLEEIPRLGSGKPDRRALAGAVS